MTLFTNIYLFFTSIHIFTTPIPERIITVTVPEDEIVIVNMPEYINY